VLALLHMVSKWRRIHYAQVRWLADRHADGVRCRP
jgi:hypothetical protein